MIPRAMLLCLMVVSLVSVDTYQPASAGVLSLGTPGNENWDVIIGATGFNNFVASLATYGGDLYAGGGFTSPGNRIARWNGMSWEDVGGGVDGTVYPLVGDGSYLYAGGVFNSAGSCTSGCNRIARWDGNGWSALGSGFDSGEVMALAVDGSGNVYAGGSISNYLMKWDGSGWEDVGGGPGGVVFALAFDGDGNLYAGGSFNSNDGGVANYLAVWDGSSWSAVDEFDAFDNAVYSMVFDEEGQLLIGGAFSYPGSYIARRTSGGWDAGWGGTDGTVTALATDSCGGVFVGGDFTMAGSTMADSIAYYDGAVWDNLGDGIAGIGNVQALRISHGVVTVGGSFGMTGNTTANNVGAWLGRDCVAVSAAGAYTLYEGEQAVGFHLNQRGTLATLKAQRYNRDHPAATDPLKNGAYWEIEGLNGSGGSATGYDVDLSLPTLGFTGDSKDKVCRFLNPGWDCALSEATATTLRRNNISELSVWTVGNDSGPTAVGMMNFGTGKPTARGWILGGLAGAFLVVGGFCFLRRKLHVR